jgi:hypothetical protein
MREHYRIFHFPNGFNLTVRGIVSVVEVQGITYLELTSEESVTVKPGWVGVTSKRVVLKPPVDEEVSVETEEAERDTEDPEYNGI